MSMATVESTQSISRNVKSGPVNGAGLLSLTLAAIRIKAPWSSNCLLSPEDRIITLDEVAWHDQSKDCWIVIYDRVYDITKFLHLHPGGFDVLVENAGRDATIAFRGTGHSVTAIEALRPFLIGRLPKSECIYRKPGGISISDLPE